MFALLLVLLVPVSDTGYVDPALAYQHARNQFLRGHLAEAQWEADRGNRQFKSNPRWAQKFLLLEAESMVFRGIHDTALSILQSLSLSASPEDSVESLSLQSIALTRLERLKDADAKLTDAEMLCANHGMSSCGDVLRARGILSFESGHLNDARQFFLQSLSFARVHHDQSLEGAALQNLGWVSLREEHFDEAVDWISNGYRVAIEINDDNLIQSALGNLGWAYFKLGDLDRSLELSLDAQRRAEELGNDRVQINWLTTAANVYQARQDWEHALSLYRQAVVLAIGMNNRDRLVNALEDLAQTSIDAGKLNDAEDCIRQLDPIVTQTGDPLDLLDIKFARARIASAQHRWKDAEQLFQRVDHDPASQTSMRMGAEHGLAQVYEAQNEISAAATFYRAAIATYDSARDQLKNEDSKLPFLTNATNIYSDYIHFLVQQNKADEALQIADRSRAQTLAQGLGVPSNPQFAGESSMHPNDLARRDGAALLFYWLADKQSYLWAITGAGTSLYTLPPEPDIAESIKRYRSALLGLGDPVENSDPNGLALYRTLVQPAAAFIGSNPRLVVLSDGVLSQLNFETLIVPTPRPHYLVEDATIISAPSLHLLAAASSRAIGAHKLLLLGDAISPNPDYPDLPMASIEMNQIEQHFDAQNTTVFAREQASPAAYLSATPQRFGYIHFVAHGVASRTDPLDSAIILSRSSPAEDSFKLHAREIIQHPLHANLVTVSACYGSGTRSYVGEGSIGLAWAFLRAGAHNVIGALWEVSDQSTPQLMGSLYAGIQKGEPPSAALHQAKLNMLHSGKEFRKPFYWAPLQIYTGL